MTTPRARRTERRHWGPGHYRQLFTGTDDFGDAWGDAFALHPDDRADWPAGDVLDDMRAAWEAVEAGRLTGHREYPMFSARSWGYRVFVLGESPLVALENRRGATHET